jgi:hypothetical protein
MDRELATKIEAMFAKLRADGYDGKHEKVVKISRATRMALSPAEGRLGPWEAQELAYAEAAVRVNLPLLTLNATAKTFAVSQLPRDEYEYGFSYGGHDRR